jgi:hypothetical protein
VRFIAPLASLSAGKVGVWGKIRRTYLFKVCLGKLNRGNLFILEKLVSPGNA